MTAKNKLILVIPCLLAFSIFADLAFKALNPNIEVGSFYVTKQYENDFVLKTPHFSDTIQVIDVKNSSIKYVGWIGWEFVNSKEEFVASFVPCVNCVGRRDLLVRVKYKDRQRK